MKLCSIISGSSGNCVYLDTGNTRVLIDAGLSGKQLENRMKAAGLQPHALDAIFVTHEHSDHIASVGVLSRRYHIPVFATEGTWNAIGKRIGRISQAHRRVFRKEEPFAFRDMVVLPFASYHDVEDPVGYVFRTKEHKVSVLTDTGTVDEHMCEVMAGSDVYYLEANHDEYLLEIGPYPQLLKQRIRSEKGHLSNRQTANLLCNLLEGRGEQVLLGHLSEENNTPEICYETIASALESMGWKIGQQVHLRIAGRFSPSALLDCAAPFYALPSVEERRECQEDTPVLTWQYSTAGDW